ncbi:proteoglycan 4-like [Clytia hemisphaerica]|uniref:proteoglycan 4-like n=1 Tax=Clytia hemisphaerica TaxID=252671 RepID=UPI0034D4CCE7
MHLSSMDKGTYKCNTVRSGNPKALGDIKQRYEQIKEFFIMQLEALVVSAFMKQENMESVNDDCIPEHIQDANAKKRWLNGRISMMLETYVIPHFRTLIGSIKKEGDVDENDETINQAQNESTDKSVPVNSAQIISKEPLNQNLVANARIRYANVNVLTNSRVLFRSPDDTNNRQKSSNPNIITNTRGKFTNMKIILDKAVKSKKSPTPIIITNIAVNQQKPKATSVLKLPSLATREPYCFVTPQQPHCQPTPQQPCLSTQRKSHLSTAQKSRLSTPQKSRLPTPQPQLPTPQKPRFLTPGQPRLLTQQQPQLTTLQQRCHLSTQQQPRFPTPGKLHLTRPAQQSRLPTPQQPCLSTQRKSHLSTPQKSRLPTPQPRLPTPQKPRFLTPGQPHLSTQQQRCHLSTQQQPRLPTPGKLHLPRPAQQSRLPTPQQPRLPTPRQLHFLTPNQAHLTTPPTSCSAVQVQPSRLQTPQQAHLATTPQYRLVTPQKSNFTTPQKSCTTTSQRPCVASPPPDFTTPHQTPTAETPIGVESIPAENQKANKESKDDSLLKYSCSLMTWGLCLLNADDAVREGDGNRLMNVYEMFQLLFRMMGNRKYSYSLLRLKACRLALLTPKMAHQLIWNRFFNRNGGVGMNISRDLRLEHINRFMKEMIKSQGMQNISDANVYKISKAYQGIREICDSMLQNVDVLQSSGHHSNTHKNEMFESVLKEFGDNNNFSSEPNKTLTTQFKKLQQNRFKNLETMVPWIKGHVRDWDVQNDSLCNFKTADN